MTQPIAPATTNNYYVTITGFRDLSLPCQSTNLAGLSSGLSFMAVRGSQNGVPMPADSVSYEDLSLTFLHDHKMESYFNLMEWFNAVHLKKTDLKQEDFHTIVEVVVKDKQHKDTLKFVYYNCLPSNIGGVELDITDDGSYVKNTVTVSYSHYKVVNLITGQEINFD